MSDSSTQADTPIGVFAGTTEQADQIMAIVNMWRSTLALAQSPGVNIGKRQGFRVAAAMPVAGNA